MKSALDLALEKSESLLDKDRTKLTPEQIAAIDETRRPTKPGGRSRRSSSGSGSREARAEGDPQAAAEQREKLQEEMSSVREALFAERDGKIEAIPPPRVTAAGLRARRGKRGRRLRRSSPFACTGSAATTSGARWWTRSPPARAVST